MNLNNNFNIEFGPDEKSINNFIQSINMFGEIFIPLFEIKNSLIIKSKEDTRKFIDLISKKLKINKMDLLYRSTRDGNGYKNLMDKINNKSNLIFLYLTGKDRIFGHYFKAKLENLEKDKDQYYTDENAFAFSLNNNLIYKILVSQKALRFYHQVYPLLTGNTAKGNGFYFDGNSINDDGLLNQPKIYDFKENSELTNNSKAFKELEIYEINAI